MTEKSDELDIGLEMNRQGQQEKRKQPAEEPDSQVMGVGKERQGEQEHTAANFQDTKMLDAPVREYSYRDQKKEHQSFLKKR